MSFLEKMQTRYTVKKYNSKGKIEAEQIDQLKKILNLSPSSINSQPWNFVFVTNPEVKEKLGEASYWNKEKILESSHLIVFQVLKNSKDFEQQIEGKLPEGSVNFYKNFVKSKGETAIKSWMGHQVYLSLGVLLSACAEMGIDSTPMEGIEPDQYDLILSNEKYETLFVVAIGIKDETDSNQPKITPKTRQNKEQVIVEL